MSAQLSLLDLIPAPTKACHYCGGRLTEKEVLLPATCERSPVCTDCCQPCQGAALQRILGHYAKSRRWPR